MIQTTFSLKISQETLTLYNCIQSVLVVIVVVYLQVLCSDAVVLRLDLFEGRRKVRKSEGHVDFSHGFINLGHEFFNFLNKCDMMF